MLRRGSIELAIEWVVNRMKEISRTIGGRCSCTFSENQRQPGAFSLADYADVHRDV